MYSVLDSRMVFSGGIGLISNDPRVEASYVGLLINNYEQREVVPKIREDYLFSDLNTIVLSYSQRRRSCFYSE
uniref:Uncharacterized protein n=1 Tax=Magallana gigas TaxID=29159 RepID=K1PW24_MAGGI